jgi:hydroxybutyrate-dimer hydrolase
MLPILRFTICRILFSNWYNKPSFIHGEIIKTSYDGSKNDLLTGGLGKSGLAGSAPTFTDPKNPTASELRTLAIYNNYRALVDISEGGATVFFTAPT